MAFHDMTVEAYVPQPDMYPYDATQWSTAPGHGAHRRESRRVHVLDPHEGVLYYCHSPTHYNVILGHAGLCQTVPCFVTRLMPYSVLYVLAVSLAILESSTQRIAMMVSPQVHKRWPKAVIRASDLESMPWVVIPICE